MEQILYGYMGNDEIYLIQRNADGSLWDVAIHWYGGLQDYWDWLYTGSKEQCIEYCNNMQLDKA